jgi:signal transduction histidine kinase
MERRKRQFRLFLIAVMLPAALMFVLTLRFLWREEELALQRADADRGNAVEQVRRELTAKLETIELQGIRKIESPTDSSAADPAIVFVTPWRIDEITMPESKRTPAFHTPDFLSFRDLGEIREFQSKDPKGAAEAYRRALQAAKLPEEECEARLTLGRTLVKAGRPQEALPIYRVMLETCSQTPDEAGMPFALYAANRLIDLKLDVPAATTYLTGQAHSVQLRPSAQTAMIRTLLQSVGTEEAKEAERTAVAQVSEIEQVLTLVKEPALIKSLTYKEWVAYGSEPWLFKVIPATGVHGPLLFVVSSSKVTPPEVRLSTQPGSESYPLTPGFAGLTMQFGPGRSFSGGRSTVSMYSVGIALILCLTILGGYLLLHGVNRDLQMAELRSHFVASVSHELKTPLTAIRMFSETLVLGRTRDEQTRSEYLETIMNESERLARLVDNVLDFSKIEQGKKIYRMRSTVLPDVVRSAARAMQYPLEQQGFNLSVSIDETLPALSADADALEQAVLNLLSNAMKYSGDARQIDLCCGRRNGHAVIAVTDRGIGIASADHPRIFEKFYRVRSSQTDLIAGTGLGLTLVKHIAHAHGGSVDVQSAAGKGSTFSLQIPIHSSEASS